MQQSLFYLEAISKMVNCIIQLIFAGSKDKQMRDGFLLKMNGPNESHDSGLREASRVHFECKQFADVIIEAMKGFKNESSIAFLRQLLETWIFLSVFFYANNLNAQTELTLENWMSLKNGRTRYLFGTTNKNKILNSFIPSGERVLISNEKTPSGISIKGWEIVIRHGVYYSNEENPDTSKDQPASVIVYRLENEEKQPYFAGKGYKFSLIKEPHTKIKPLFIIRHWSGVMGCSFIDLSFLETQKIGSKPVIEYRSTKTTVNDRVGKLCEAPTPSGLFLSD